VTAELNARVQYNQTPDSGRSSIVVKATHGHRLGAARSIMMGKNDGKVLSHFLVSLTKAKLQPKLCRFLLETYYLKAGMTGYIKNSRHFVCAYDVEPSPLERVVVILVAQKREHITRVMSFRRNEIAVVGSIRLPKF
jgi:hypothetical protein